MATNKKTPIPNAERSEAMRLRLLDATIKAIAAEGWANTSTSKICIRAGVTRGAQTHHFPTKNALLLAAAHENSQRYQAGIAKKVALLKEHDNPIRAYLELMWNACFEEHFVQSWVEVLVAARTDISLKESIKKIDAAGIETIKNVGQSLASGGEAIGLSKDIIELSVYLLRGMVLQNSLHENKDEQRRLFERWFILVETQLNC